MENTFGIKNEIIKQALKFGIMKKKEDGTWQRITGIVSLTYIGQMEKFVLAYGNGPADAGFVFIDDHGKTWDVVKKDGGNN